MASFHEAMAKKMAEMGGDDEAPDSSDDAPDADAGLKAAAQAIMDAVHSKDVDALADALKSALAIGPGPDDDDDVGSHAAMVLIPHKGA